MKTENENIWLTQLSKTVINRSPVGPAASILLTIGLFPLVLFLTFYFFIRNTATLQFFYLWGLATLVLVIGPYFIYRYDVIVFPKFIERAQDVTPYEDNREIIDIGQRYKKFFKYKYYYICMFWTAIIFCAIYVNFDYFVDVGVSGITDPVFIPFILLAAYGGVVTGMGIHMVLTTILCIQEVGDLNFTVDPLHPDGLGGLSSIGYFAISSTTLFSIGSLGLPTVFDIAGHSGFGVFVYLIVVIYIGTVIVSFVYPTLYINRRAKEIRRNLLEDKREEIYSLHNQIMEIDNTKDVKLLTSKLDTLRDEYDAYSQINLYPLSPSILSKLISSIMLPLCFLLFETYIVS